MSQKNISGTWYAYRYNLSRDVMKSSETTLEIEKAQAGSRQARFKLSGWDVPIEIEMIQDPRTSAWHGEFESLDFRWSRIECEGTDLLVGHAVDRGSRASRDFFVAVRSRRTLDLPEKAVYTFESAYLTPSSRRDPLMQKGGVSINLTKNKNEISFEGETYAIISSSSYEGGLRLSAENVKATGFMRVGLWLLPTQESGHLLATGYFYHLAFGRFDSRPTSPECNFGFVLC